MPEATSAVIQDGQAMLNLTLTQPGQLQAILICPFSLAPCNNAGRTI